MPRGVGSSSSSSQLVCSRPERRRPLIACQPAQSAGVRVVAGDLLGIGGPAGQFGDGGVARVLDDRHPHRLEQRLAGERQIAGGHAAVVARPVPRPCGQMQRVAGTPLDPLTVDLGPALPCDHQHHRIPRMAVDGRHHAGVDVVHQRVHRAGGTVAVGAGVHPDPGAPCGLHRCHVLECDHGLLVPAPLLDEVGAPLLLHVVVRDLGRRTRCHVLPFRPVGNKLCSFV